MRNRGQPAPIETESLRHASATNLLNRYLDPDSAAWLTGYFAKNGVTMLMGESLNGFEGKTVLRNIQTKSGNRIAAGLAVVACGAEPNLDLVRNTPLSGPHGSPVTEYLETEEKGIYSIGDLAFYPDRSDGRHAAANALGQCARAGPRCRREYDREETHSLRAVALLLDGDVRSSTGFCWRLQFLAFSGGVDRNSAKKKWSARYLHGERMRGILLCGATAKEIEKAKAELRGALGK